MIFARIFLIINVDASLLLFFTVAHFVLFALQSNSKTSMPGIDPESPEQVNMVELGPERRGE